MDRTLQDINRRDISLSQDYIERALPEYFGQDFPKFISLLKAYYDFLNQPGNFGDQLKSLATTRDIGQTAKSNLTYIEDELLLGQNYLEGILDTRTGAELSNNYYRAKGTKYAIERFFRSFFGTDPIVEYGKNYIFTVGESQIGPNSQKYIMDDKIYQYWGLLIKSDVARIEWLELYKLFAHPGGMYVGSQVQVVSVNRDPSFDTMPISIPPASLIPVYTSVAIGTLSTLGEYSGIITSDVDSSGYMRIDLDAYRIEDFVDSDSENTYGTVQYLDTHMQTIQDMIKETSPRMDEDSGEYAGDLSALKLSNVKITMDVDAFDYYPVDSSN